MSGPKEHARLSPSSAHRWMECPGSIAASEGKPDVETEYQREGTAAHAMAEALLRGNHDPAEVLAPDMYDAVMLFVNTVQSDVAEYGGKLSIEQRVTLAMLNPPEDIFGTADAMLVSQRAVRAYDLKYGRGVLVEVDDNPQLMIYIIGAVLKEYVRRGLSDELTTFQGDVLDDALAQFDTFESVIVQPRMGHEDGQVRRKSYTAAELKAFAQQVLEAARAVQEEPHWLRAGDWCHFCPAKAFCPELLKHAQVVAQTAFENMPIERPPEPDTLPIEIVGDILSKVGILESWIAGLKDRAYRELSAGNDVPGFKLIEKRARRQWTDPMAVREWAHAAGLDVEDYLEPRELKSPAQLEKVVGQKNLPQELVVKVSSGVKLAPASDPAPAISAGAQSAFALLSPGSVDATNHEEQT